MPAHGVQFQPRAELLTDEEIVFVVRVAASLGVDKLRLTGGEPTVRPGLVELVAALAAIPGIHDLAMTTNGLLLSKLAGPLAQAGLKRVNISLDTLDPEKFRRITRYGRVEQVLDGIQACAAAGLVPIKLNAVVVRGYNEEDVGDLAALTIEHDWQMRFIEVMPFAEVGPFAQSSYVPSGETMTRIERKLGRKLAALPWNGDEPSRTFRLDGAKGTLGFISSVSEPFCAGCGRLRLTAEGKLKLCLLRDAEVDLRAPLRDGTSFEQMQAIIRDGAYHKPWGHDLEHGVFPQLRVMSQIGG